MIIRSLDETYIIAEIGQNHNGDINIAKKLIDQLDNYPYDTSTGERLQKANAIKLTKRDLSDELTVEAYNKPYDGPNSFGETYGEHREFLELSYEDHVELGKYIKSRGFEFVETICSLSAMKLLDMIQVDKIKVASRDLTNIPLLTALSERSEPIILSTGMANEKDLYQALEIFRRGKNKEVSVLHCLSEYPARSLNLNLRTITWLQEKVPSRLPGKRVKIGYSDHSIGTFIPVGAVALEAKIIEKHVTLDTSMKGSDHAGSADMSTFRDMVRDIRMLERALGYEWLIRDASVEQTRIKLERSLATKNTIQANAVVALEDLHMISPGSGLKWEDRDLIIGKRAKMDILANTLVTEDMVEDE
jgi:sialic acid synthase